MDNFYNSQRETVDANEETEKIALHYKRIMPEKKKKN